MSWPYVAAAWRVRLVPTSKLVLLALADQTDTRGQVSASVRDLERLTGLSDRSVQRTMKALSKEGLAILIQPGTATAPHRYRLEIPGVRVSPGVKVSPGDTLANDGCQAVATLLPVLIPKSKSLKAGASAPTLALLKKLVHEQMAERQYELNRPHELIELSKDLQSRCKAAGFEMENWDLLYQAIREVLGAKGIPGFARPARTHAR